MRTGLAAAALVASMVLLGASLRDPVATAPWLDRLRETPRAFAHQRLGAVVEAQSASVVARLGGPPVAAEDDSARAEPVEPQ